MAEFDTVIRNGTVVEATGIPAYRADVAIKDGKIAQMSGSIKGSGAKELDATGCIVAPGQSSSTLTTTGRSTGTRTAAYPAGMA